MSEEQKVDVSEIIVEEKSEVVEEKPVITEEKSEVVEEKPVVTNDVISIIDIIRDLIKKREEKEYNGLSFSKLIEMFLQAKDLDYFSIKLTPELQQYLLILCKQNQDVFNNLGKSLKEIIVDNTINTKDIPEVLVLVDKIHRILKENPKGLPNIEPYEVIKIILHLVFVVYIETNKVENKQLIIDILKIIDMSINLMKLVPLKKSGGCLFKCGV
jgi:hypothetical protein